MTPNQLNLYFSIRQSQSDFDTEANQNSSTIEVNTAEISEVVSDCPGKIHINLTKPLTSKNKYQPDEQSKFKRSAVLQIYTPNTICIASSVFHNAYFFYSPGSP